MSIGHRIVELRKSKGWTQAALAKYADLSASTIAMYETNRRKPDLAALQKLATALQVPIDALADNAAATNYPELLAKTEVASTTDQSKSDQEGNGLTHLALTREEARIILFIRMNPMCIPFLESYIRADARQREQLARTWRLIHDFQGQPQA